MKHFVCFILHADQKLRRVCAVALLVLFARTAGARLVASDLGFFSLGRLLLRICAFDFGLIVAAYVAGALFVFRS